MSSDDRLSKGVKMKKTFSFQFFWTWKLFWPFKKMVALRNKGILEKFDIKKTPEIWSELCKMNIFWRTINHPLMWRHCMTNYLLNRQRVINNKELRLHTDWDKYHFSWLLFLHTTASSLHHLCYYNKQALVTYWHNSKSLILVCVDCNPPRKKVSEMVSKNGIRKCKVFNL